MFLMVMRTYRLITPADVVDDFDDMFAHDPLWDGDGVSFLTLNDRSAIAAALARPSNTVPTSSSNVADFRRVLLMKLGHHVRLLQGSKRGPKGRRDWLPLQRSCSILLSEVPLACMDGLQLPVRVKYTYCLGLRLDLIR